MQTVSKWWPRVSLRKALEGGNAYGRSRPRVREHMSSPRASPPNIAHHCHPLRRIRSLENHVSEIRHTQASMQATLQEIAFHLRTGHTRSPSTYSAMPFQQHSPSMQSVSSPPMSASLGGQFTTEPSHNGQPNSAGSGPTPFTPHGPVNPMMSPTGTRQSQSRDPVSLTPHSLTRTIVF
jgi:anaerobic selenocysteine-containing dehydrogenase